MNLSEFEVKRYVLIVEDLDGNIRRYPLDHEYATIEEADREAEDLADQVYTENDVAWTVVPATSSLKEER